MNNTIKKMKENRIFIAIVIFMAVYFIVCISRGYMDSDFFHIANTGRWILENKAIPYTNENFVLEGYGTIAQQWLYSIILYVSFEIMGMSGVRILVFLQTAVFAAIIYKLSRIKGLDKNTSVISTFVTLYMFNVSLNCRPELITGILLAIQLCVTESYRVKRNWKTLYILPMLTLLEMNLHGTYWIFHFIFLLPYLIPFDKFLKGKSRVIDDDVETKPFLIPIVLMTASLFANPYGVKGILCLFWSRSISKLGISELQSVDILTAEFLMIAVAVAALVYLYIKRKLKSSTLYFTLGLSFMYVIALKNHMLFSFSCVFLIANLLGELNLQVFYRFLNKSVKTEPLIYAAMAALTVLNVIDMHTGAVSSASSELLAPEKAANYLYDSGENLSEIKLFTTFNDGAYFTWCGVEHIYMQAKTEPYLEEINGQEDLVQEFYNLSYYSTTEDIEDFLDKYQFDYLYVPYTFGSLQTYLDLSPDYVCVETSNNKVDNVEDNPLMWKLYKHSEN